MGNALALLSALCFGTTHFVSGLLARRAPGVTVALYAQIGGTLLSVLLAPVAPSGAPGGSALAWGALSGLGTGVGVGFLYRGMGRGAMSVVVPVSDVTAVALPVLVGLAVLGERPTVLSLLGIAATFPALWLVSRGSGTRRSAADRPTAPPGAGSSATPSGAGRSALVDALVAGAGFAVHFVAIARIPAEAGLWPVVVSRVVSVVLLAGLMVRQRAPWRVAPRLVAPAAAAGAVGTLATVLYLDAIHRQLLAVATVLAALYPAVPVLLAMLVLRERTTRSQTTGLLCAGAAIALIALA